MKEIKCEFMDIFISKDLFNGFMNDSLCDENDVRSKKSLVLMEAGASVRLFSPIAQETIDEDTIDYHLKQLKKRR